MTTATTPLSQTLIQTRPAETGRLAPLAEASLGAAEPARELAGAFAKERGPGQRVDAGTRVCGRRWGPPAFRWLFEGSRAELAAGGSGKLAPEH